jgi:hypothetical protein
MWRLVIVSVAFMVVVRFLAHLDLPAFLGRRVMRFVPAMLVSRVAARTGLIPAARGQKKAKDPEKHWDQG